jgi:glycolate oxidase iron-sulfur subunit
MSNLNELSQLLKEIEDQLADCMKCGMCQAVCPVFTETGDEGDVARGKIFLLERLGDQLLNDAKGAKKRIEKCLLCGTCGANCPSGVKILEIFLKARAALTEYVGLSPVKQIIFRGMLKHPKRFTGLVDLASKFQGLGISKANLDQGTCCSKMMSGLIGDRHFKPLAKKPFHKICPELDTKPGKSGIKIAFYPGCVVDKMNPEIGEAALKVFAHHGVGVFMPANQACCGIPALASGDRQTFENLLDHNISCFKNKDFDYIITPCATCSSTIKEIWPLMAGKKECKNSPAVKMLSEKTMDISQFLVDVLKVAPVQATGKATQQVTYHDPCHLGKSLGVYSQPRTLVRANPDCELVEMNEADYCCGNGGSFNLQNYDLSCEIGMRKRNNIIATGADIVATSCPACMMQMTDMLSQNNDTVKVKHVIELYADSMK